MTITADVWHGTSMHNTAFAMFLFWPHTVPVSTAVPIVCMQEAEEELKAYAYEWRDPDTLEKQPWSFKGFMSTDFQRYWAMVKDEDDL
jgi:hypothetical protein